jgi:two-component system response regulator AtoC
MGSRARDAVGADFRRVASLARMELYRPTAVEEETDDDTLTGLRAPVAIAAEPAGALSLIIMSPGSTANVPLPERGSLALGRATDCEVCIADPKLSRRHAEIRCGEEISIVDLGSRNGTLLRDTRLPANVPVVLRAGDSIALGGTVVVLQRAVTPLERPRNVWSHGYFEARVEEECSRATSDSAFAIVRVRLDVPAPAEGVAESQHAPSPLVAWLRTGDLVALYAPNEYEVLLTQTASAEAEGRAAELERSLKTAGVTFAMAVAVYPRDGRSPEGLIEHTTRILRRDAAPAGSSPAERAILPSGAIERMDKIVARVAAGVISVLVLGETGVGKEILSRRIHALSPRASRPLVCLNCAALSESLLESELFGHEKGAFTGALQAKAGLLESADGGTVFLDEIGEMPLSVQAKLLRVIEQREVTRVGAVRPRPIDVRFVSATHRDLEAEIARGRFRQDLYFRLSGISLALPPLRERVDEIEPLARSFVEQSCRAMRRRQVPSLAEEAVETLRRYQWPGNIRELRNVMERAVLLSSGDVIGREHLPVEKLGEVLPPSVHFTAPFASLPRPRAASPEPGGESARETLPPAAGEIDERLAILQALEKHGGNQSLAAVALGMSRQTLIRRLQEYAIPRPRKRE